MLVDTIVAISTALKDGAISIVRMSGKEAIEVANRLFSRNLQAVATHTIHYGWIHDPQTREDVDEVFVSVFRSPKTFTREDVVEINCHGGIYITKKIVELCLREGCRLATPGEFSQRAFLNGRIDLTQAEAIHDMIMATHSREAQLAVAGIKGSVKQLLDPLLQELLDVIAAIEVHIDYPEYDSVEEISEQILKPKVVHWRAQMDKILKQAASGQLLKAGIKTAIVGKANVGKSSLLNALLEEDKAIVSEIEGTTRDVVEGFVEVGGVTLHLLDTAGIRNTKDVVEKIGIDRSRKAMEAAQLIFLVFDASKDVDEEDIKLLKLTENKQRICIYNKKDRMHDQSEKDGVYISAKNKDIEQLRNKIQEIFLKDMHIVEQPILQNERHIAQMHKAKVAMENVAANLEHASDLDLDILAIDLQASYYALKDILGEVSRDDLLDTLFSKFCLGK
ncbi:MAG: tRNA uridine-5-carboxymethylaminomethyl(34) synthesis GTPase MnmE [Breznakia sp.]